MRQRNIEDHYRSHIMLHLSRLFCYYIDRKLSYNDIDRDLTVTIYSSAN